MFKYLFTFGLATFAACSAAPSSTSPTDPAATTEPVAAESPTTQPEASPTSQASAPQAAAVTARVADARARLAASPAGEKVWAAIEAHGGLASWFSSGKLQFRFNYQPTTRPATDTLQVVDPWASLARHEVVGSDGVCFGWDGATAWFSPPQAELRTNVRFWALTPYYFVGMPFVLADRGVVLEALDDAEFEGQTYDIVKASFEPGTGDASGDFYVLYLDKETHIVRALRYVVSYPGFRPEGGHGPEKLMAYDAQTRVGELLFASAHRTFKFDAETGTVGELVTNVEVSEFGWKTGLPDSYFDPPAGAQIILGWHNTPR